jgi:uncharacterized protein
MSKFFPVVLILLSVAVFAQAQTKVILHLQSADTLVHKSLVNQVGNIKKAMPEAEIEVVCHGPGLELLLKKKSTYVNRIHNMNLMDVSFVGCEFTMSQKNIKRDDLVPFAQTVPYGLVEIIKKQKENWNYVKLGF